MKLEKIRLKNLTTPKPTLKNGTYNPGVITDEMVQKLLKPVLNLDELLKGIK